MRIRFATPQDVPGILSLLRQVGAVHHKGRPDIFRAGAQKYGPSQILAMLDKPATPIFVAEQEAKVVGYGFCQLQVYENDPVMADRTQLYIDDLCVDEDCRGQQIGKAIFREICRYAKMRRCSAITLNVWSCNEGALRFYEKLGLLPQKIGMELLLEEE